MSKYGVSVTQDCNENAVHCDLYGTASNEVNSFDLISLVQQCITRWYVDLAQFH